MSAQHTPMRQGFTIGKHVFVPGCAKPINAGSKDRAAFIVRACNAHDELVAALRKAESFIAGFDDVDCEETLAVVVSILKDARAALAKAGAA